MQSVNSKENDKDDEIFHDEFEDVSIEDVQNFPIEFKLLTSYERYSIYEQQVFQIFLRVAIL